MVGEDLHELEHMGQYLDYADCRHELAPSLSRQLVLPVLNLFKTKISTAIK
jgi:hypothetical protein